MAACTLDVGSRRVLVSEEGPPAAEFALFDASEIELSSGETGGLRESGYRTTASEALRRLAVAGVTVDLAEECARLAHGRIADAYARGPTVRRFAPLFGAAELFEGGTYDSTLRRYEGAWFDLALMANDAGIARSTGALQAASLAMMLAEVRGDTPVVLTTLGHTESLRLGERTLRRHAIDGLATVPRALRHLAEHAPSPQHTDGGPTRGAILGMVAARLDMCVQTEARERLSRLARAMSVRSKPSHGPLAAPGLWEAEQLLSQGEMGAALGRVEAHEASHGREPGTLYLRARLSLLRGKESPRIIAQRVGELAANMSDFPEAVLLAAQAWNAAGETRSALPFARDLVSNPRIHDELRAAAESILRAPRVPLDGPSGGHEYEDDSDTDGDDFGDDVRLQELAERETRSVRSVEPISMPAPRRSSIPPLPPLPPSRLSASEPPPLSLDPPTPRLHSERPPSPAARSVPPPQVIVRDPRVELPLSRTLSEPPPRPRSLTPPDHPGGGTQKDIRRFLTPPERMSSPLPPRVTTQSFAPPPVAATPRRISSIPPPPTHRSPEHPPSDRARPFSQNDPTGVIRPSPRPVLQPAPWPTALRAPREDNARPEEIEHTPAVPRTVTQRFMRGASMPPLMSDPVPRLPRPSIIPRVDVDEPDLVEALPLPRGAVEHAVDTHVIPRSALEARARFTVDARELARRYRHEDGIELRLEPRAVQSMQRRLSARFPSRVVSTPEEAREAELHGALLSELLARMLGAEWTDIAPTELGYWAMTLTLKGGGEAKRVWPFGRILRFIASGGEDDLVAFFRKLRDIA